MDEYGRDDRDDGIDLVDEDADHMMAKTIRAMAVGGGDYIDPGDGAYEPEPLPANELRVRAWTDSGMFTIEVTNPPTIQSEQILLRRLPAMLELFLRKHGDYEDFQMPKLGARAHFVGIWRKTLKLRRGLWEGKELETEQVSELLMDLFGHVLLAYDEYEP
jgi:hypothetical protein